MGLGLSFLIAIIPLIIFRLGGTHLTVGVVFFVILMVISIIIAISEGEFSAFLIAGAISLGISLLLLGLSAWLVTAPAVDTITFAGKVVHPSTSKWNNNRLVVIYKDEQEIGRTFSRQGEYKENNLGIIDGLFVVEVPNEYKLKSKDLKGFNFRVIPDSIWKAHTTRFQWFPEVYEGKTLSTHITSKNIDYVVKVFDGDESTLPPEIRDGKTELRGNQIVVSKPDSEVPVSDQSYNALQIDNIEYATKTEIVSVNTTLPINVLNNCDASLPVSQKYTQTQTFIHKYLGEVGAEIGVEIPIGIWGKVLPSLQAKYGFEDNQVDTISIEYTTAADAGTSVAYIVTLREVWESGVAKVSQGDIILSVPFRVKTHMIYEITSQPRTCP